MWPDAVVMRPPPLDHDAGLLEVVEHLAVQKFIPQPRVDALAVAVLLETARPDVSGLRANRCDPVADGFGDELRTIVGADMAGHSA